MDEIISFIGEAFPFVTSENLSNLSFIEIVTDENLSSFDLKNYNPAKFHDHDPSNQRQRPKEPVTNAHPEQFVH